MTRGADVLIRRTKAKGALLFWQASFVFPGFMYISRRRTPGLLDLSVRPNQSVTFFRVTSSASKIEQSDKGFTDFDLRLLNLF